MINLTYEQIENLPAGREMDALIAEHVFGMEWSRWDGGNGREISALHSPRKFNYAVYDGQYFGEKYSTDIAAAWAVNSKVSKESVFNKRRLYFYELQKTISIRLKLSSEVIAWPDALCFLEPEDICRAALLVALEIEQRKNG